MKKKKGKRFKERSIRNPKWDYGWNAYYLVTICTHKRFPYFASINNGLPRLSEIGIVADKIWKEIPNRFPYACGKNPMLNNNLSRIIRWYKGRVTYDARKINPNYKWQALFHDSIIHNKHHLDNVRQYIQINPIRIH